MISLVTAQVPALFTHVYYMYIKDIHFYPYSSDTLGARSKSAYKFNDNYTCIHWTKSVYNIHKLNWNDIQKILTKLIIFENTREYLLNPGGILISTIMWTQLLLFLCSVVCRCYFYPILNALHSQNVMTQLL